MNVTEAIESKNLGKTKKVVKIIDSTNYWVAKTVGWLILVITVFLAIEVILRYVFNNPTDWIEESMQYVFGGYCILAGGYTLLEKTHVNVDILQKRLSPRSRAVLDLITALIFFIFVGVLLWKGGETAWWSISHKQRSGSVWHGPMYYTMAMLPLGAFLLLIQGIAKFIRDFYFAKTGRELK
jgi:TRAP-type mannitol/chloroaromatic compound transport system permease small subunit